MAIRRWLGQAAAVAQIDTLTVGGTPGSGRVYTATINTKTVSYTATGGDTNTTIATALTALLNGQDAPAEFGEVTWTSSAAVITCTGQPGVPFTLTASNSGSGTGTLTRAGVQTATGPNHWDNVANWSGAALPANSDDVILQNSETDILYGLGQSAITLARLLIYASFTGTIGLPKRNTAGFEEYRSTELAIGAVEVNIGLGDGAGSSRVRINSGTTSPKVWVGQTAAAADEHSVCLIGDLGDLVVTRGSVGVAATAGEAATIDSVSVGFVDSEASDSSLFIGEGASSVGGIRQTGGQIITEADFSTANLTGGVFTIRNSVTATSITADAAQVILDGSADVADVTLANGAGLDASRSGDVKAIGTLSIGRGCSVNDPFQTITLTNPIALPNGFDNVTLDFGVGITIQL